MSERSSPFYDVHHDTTHDFNTENLVMMVLGGYVVLKEPTTYFVLNILQLSSVFLVYIYLIIMAVITIIFTSVEKVIVVQTMQTLCLLWVGLVLPGARLYTDDCMNIALKLIRKGIYHYPGEQPDEEHYKIKSERVAEIRETMSVVTKLCFFCAFSNTFMMPFMRFLSKKDSDMNGVINPYLPLPIYMPFNTTTLLGYGFAFFTNAVFFFFLYATIASLIETYLSCSLQLIAQLEILNYSLQTIEKRAYQRLVKNDATYKHEPSNILYDCREFQEQLYFCLRENIVHHHVILKFTEAVSPFLEAINSICILSFSIVLAASLILVLQNPSINIALIGTLVSDVFCYYEMCKVGQEISDKSVEVSDSLYSTPWTSCNKKFSILLTIMLANTQKPIVIRARGFKASASLQTYSDMMTLAYKIMSLIRTGILT